MRWCSHFLVYDIPHHLYWDESFGSNCIFVWIWTYEEHRGQTANLKYMKLKFSLEKLKYPKLNWKARQSSACEHVWIRFSFLRIINYNTEKLFTELSLALKSIIEILLTCTASRLLLIVPLRIYFRIDSWNNNWSNTDSCEIYYKDNGNHKSFW